MQEQSKNSKTEKSPSDYEISIIKALLELKKSDKSISNQKILGYINHRRVNVENHINAGRIADIKNRKIGADIPPASEEEAKRFMGQYENPIQKDKELDEILKVDANNPDFLIAQENDRIEFKKSFQGYKDEAFLKFVQGVANNKGGYILFGIDENNQFHRGKVVGLEEKGIKAFWRDAKQTTDQLNAQFGQAIKFDKHQKEINSKTICILQILESENKPIIDRNGNIYYRYPGATEKIQKQDLQRIIREQMSKDITLTFSKHIEQILKNGIENSAILNIATGDVEGKGGSFVIDEALLPKIAFIREGELVEKNGAPALILKGEVKPYNAIMKTEQRVNISDGGVYECFFESKDLTSDEAKEYLGHIASSLIALFPIRFFAKKAGMNKEKVIEYLKTCKDGRNIKQKIKKLERNQPIRLDINNVIGCEKLKKANLLNLTGKDREIGKWLESIQSYDEQIIIKEKSFLIELTQKLYDYCSTNKTQYKNLLSQVRKTITYLDKVLYPLD